MADQNVFKSIGAFADKHSPEILLGFGIGGMITTVVLSVAATVKAVKAVDERHKQMRKTPKTREIIKTSWKYYIPAFITGTASIACLIGSNTVNSKRNAALATAYALSESAFKRYGEKVVETIGEKKERQIREKVSEEIVSEHPVNESRVILASNGETLCYDEISDNYFMSDMNRIQKAANDINRRLRDEMFIPLNDFYCELGLGNAKCGNLLGWYIEKGYLEVKFDTQLSNDGRPALVMMYKVYPKYDYK